MAIYQEFKDAGLPVMEFVKTRRVKEKDGEMAYYLDMEDLTADGKYSLVDIGNYEADGPQRARELLNANPEAQSMRKQMVKAMAVIHNHSIYEYHPTVSFVLRYPTDLLKLKPGEPLPLDFRIIDYSNFRKRDSGDPNHPDPVQYSESRKAGNIGHLVNFLCGEDYDMKQGLNAYYQELRKANVLQYAENGA